MDIKYSQGNAPIHPPPAHYHPDGNIISLSIIWIHIGEGDPELDAADPDGIIILLSIIWIHIGARGSITDPTTDPSTDPSVHIDKYVQTHIAQR